MSTGPMENYLSIGALGKDSSSRLFALRADTLEKTKSPWPTWPGGLICWERTAAGDNAFWLTAPDPTVYQHVLAVLADAQTPVMVRNSATGVLAENVVRAGQAAFPDRDDGDRLAVDREFSCAYASRMSWPSAFSPCFDCGGAVRIRRPSRYCCSATN
jgi:hypothetical protein